MDVEENKPATIVEESQSMEVDEDESAVVKHSGCHGFITELKAYSKDSTESMVALPSAMGCRSSTGSAFPAFNEYKSVFIDTILLKDTRKNNNSKNTNPPPPPLMTVESLNCIDDIADASSISYEEDIFYAEDDNTMKGKIDLMTSQPSNLSCGPKSVLKVRPVANRVQSYDGTKQREKFYEARHREAKKPPHLRGILKVRSGLSDSKSKQLSKKTKAFTHADVTRSVESTDTDSTFKSTTGLKSNKSNDIGTIRLGVVSSDSSKGSGRHKSNRLLQKRNSTLLSKITKTGKKVKLQSKK